MTPRFRCLAFLAGFSCLTVGCGGSGTGTTTRRAEATPSATGRIRGVVSLRGTPPAAKSEPVTKDQSICGASVPVTRLQLGRENAVRGAFVFLDGVPKHEETRPRLKTAVEQKGCEYGPHVTTLPAGTNLEIVNNDPILHNVHARETTPGGLQTVFNIAQPVRGQRTTIDAPLNKPGIIALTCEAGHPWMTAYILIADHPFVATSGDNGEFVIDDVPAGTYPIKMWHEGVQLTRIIPMLQQYEYEEPYETTQQVVVPANGEVVVNFAFELRAGN